MRHGEPLDVLRETSGSDGNIVYVDGKPVKRRGAVHRIKGSVQPLSGRDLMIVPEGDRLTEQYWVYTADDIQTNDKVRRLGAIFQVQDVKAWPSYRQARMMLVDTVERTPWPSA